MRSPTQEFAASSALESGGMLRTIEIYAQRISPKTEFLFVRIGTSQDIEGWGEATYNALNGQVIVTLRQFSEAILGKSLAKALEILGDHPNWKYGRASAIAVNALLTALFDILGKEVGRSLSALFAEPIHSKINCYANINRGTTIRSPDGWAKRAQAAQAAGFSGIKLAPFDSVKLGLDGKSRGNADFGIECTRTVRAAVGSKAGLMLDCHWRFDEPSASALIQECGELDLAWIEAPIIEDYLAIPALLRLKDVAHTAGMNLAGGEYHMGKRAFAPFLQEKVYDVANPDVRFCGILDMFEIAVIAAENGIAIAPHNHLGPVMSAVSLHFASIAPSASTLEMQFAEGDIISCLIDPDQLSPSGGYMDVPTAPGLGIVMNHDVLNLVE